MRCDICNIRTTPCPDVLLHRRKEPIQVMSSRLTLDTCCSQYHGGEFAGTRVWYTHLYMLRGNCCYWFFSNNNGYFSKRHVSSEEILSLAWPCFPRFNKESYFKWKAVNNFKGVEWGWGRGKDSKGGGVGWGWETGKDFKGGGAGGEQKSKREKDVGTTRK